MKRRIQPSCLKGYQIDPSGVGRIELTDEGEKYGCPDPIIGNCIESEGLCWWVKPLGYSYTLTLPVTKLKKFWHQTNDDQVENPPVGDNQC